MKKKITDINNHIIEQPIGLVLDLSCKALTEEDFTDEAKFENVTILNIHNNEITSLNFILVFTTLHNLLLKKLLKNALKKDLSEFKL